MLYKDLHWRRGTPCRAGTYLVYDQRRQTVRLAVVTNVDPFSYRADESGGSWPWPFRAYLGPLERVRARSRW